MKRIAVLGSTGSIGEQTLAVVAASPERFRVVALAAGRNVVQGSATDIDFWDKLKLGNVRLIMLAMPSPEENMFAAQRLSERGCEGLIAATAKYPDEIAALEAHGVHAAFNIYAEAGAGFAEHVSEKLKERSG